MDYKFNLINVEEGMNMNGKVNIGCGMLLTILGLVIAIIVALCTWTDRTLDFWCTYYSQPHHLVNVPMWISVLTTFIGNIIMLAINIISELARLVMGV